MPERPHARWGCANPGRERQHHRRDRCGVRNDRARCRVRRYRHPVHEPEAPIGPLGNPACDSGDVVAIRSQGNRIEPSKLQTSILERRQHAIYSDVDGFRPFMELVAAANMIWPSYGQAFLQLFGSIFPGYRPGTGMGSVVTGTIYALVDGVIGGAIFGWLYNLFAARKADSAKELRVPNWTAEQVFNRVRIVVSTTSRFPWCPPP